MAAMRTRAFFSLLHSTWPSTVALSVPISASRTTNHSCCVHFGGWTACGKRSRVRLGWEARTVRPRGWVLGSGERDWRRWSRRLLGEVSHAVVYGTADAYWDGTSIFSEMDMEMRDGYG